MKRAISLMMVVAMCCLLFAACGGNGGGGTKIEIPEGYKEYNNEWISFGYPEDWTVADGATIVMQDPAGTGDNITLTYEPKSDLYKNMTKESYLTMVEAAYSAMGLAISNVSVDQIKSGIGNTVTRISQTTTMTAANITMSQVLYVIAAGDRNYVVTVTSVTNVTTLSENVLYTLKTLK